MNKVQHNYAVARAYHETVEEMMKDYEREWIVKNGVKRLDGSTPDHLWQLCLDEEENMFLDYSERLDNDEGYQQLMAEKRTAYQLKTEAEDQLIDFALSIVPASVRATLDANRHLMKYREKLLDIAFKLDTKTIPASLHAKRR